MKSLRSLLIVTLLLPVTVLVSSTSYAETKLGATIFSYDGADFVRTKTTVIAEGQSAANTKLDRDSAAYKALVEKRSYTGPATVLGRDYQASYAPLIGEDGQLTGALFVGVPKQSTLTAPEKPLTRSGGDDFRVGTGAHGDLYVFVVDDSGTQVASGARPTAKNMTSLLTSSASETTSSVPVRTSTEY